MSSGTSAQLGYKKETTYGTAVTVDRFQEFASEKIHPVTKRLQTMGLRAGGSALRNNSIPFVQGYAGSIEAAPMSKGFGFWLEHLGGGIATAGPVDSAYTHTATVSLPSLVGKSLTLQVGRPRVASTTVDPYTFAGGKVTKVEFTGATDDLLKVAMDVDFKSVATGTGLATASYPTGTVEPFSFLTATLTIGGSSITDASSFKCSWSNAVKVDRNYLGLVHDEPITNDWAPGDWELVLDNDGFTQFNRIIASVGASAHAAIVATFKSPTLIGVSTYPALVFTIPAARFDGDGSNVEGPGLLKQTLKGIITDDGTNSPITIAYTTADTTP